MPIYEYLCSACGHELERIQKISDAPLKDCPACDQATLQKRVSAPSFRLAGGGWYETDFKTDKEKRRNLAGDSSAPASDSGNSETSKSSDSNAKSSDSNTKKDSKPAETG